MTSRRDAIRDALALSGTCDRSGEFFFVEVELAADIAEQAVQEWEADEGQRITDEINADPNEVMKLRKAIADAEAGKAYPRRRLKLTDEERSGFPLLLDHPDVDIAYDPSARGREPMTGEPRDAHENIAQNRGMTMDEAAAAIGHTLDRDIAAAAMVRRAREAEAIVRDLAAVEMRVSNKLEWCQFCEKWVREGHASGCLIPRARVWVSSNPQPETAD